MVDGWSHDRGIFMCTSSTGLSDQQYISVRQRNPDSKVHGANMGPIWGLQDPGGPHVGPMNFAIWEGLQAAEPAYVYASLS